MSLYEKMKSRYEMGFVTEETLKGWVKIEEKRPGRGLTREQFKEITGKEYEE